MSYSSEILFERRWKIKDRFMLFQNEVKNCQELVKSAKFWRSKLLYELFDSCYLIFWKTSRDLHFERKQPQSC